MKKYLALITIAVMGLTLICGCAKKPADDEKATLQQEDVQASQQVDNVQAETNTESSDDAQTEANKSTENESESLSKENTASETTDEFQTDTEIKVDTEAEDPQVNEVSSDDECNEKIKITCEPKNILLMESDIFIGKIISKQQITNDGSIDFPNIGVGSSDDIILYEVEVNKVYYSTAVTENTTIKVMYLWQKSFEQYEVGNTYLMAGVIQPYKDTVVIADIGILTARLDNNGTLVPNSEITKEAFSDIQTLSDFETKFVPEMKEYRLLIPDVMYDLIEVPADDTIEQSNISAEVGTNQVQSNTSSEVTTDTKPIEEQVIAVIKEAIKVDSDVTIKEWQG